MASHTWRYRVINLREEWRTPKNRGHSVAVDAALSHLTEHILSAFSFAFHTNFGVCLCMHTHEHVCTYMCTQVHSCLCMCLQRQERGFGGPVLPHLIALRWGLWLNPGLGWWSPNPSSSPSCMWITDPNFLFGCWVSTLRSSCSYPLSQLPALFWGLLLYPFFVLHSHALLCAELLCILLLASWLTDQ